MVDFIAAIMGDNCEVVLHDITTPENSIIAIKNGHLSGRKIGGPLTDLVLKVIQNKSYKSQNYVLNYKASAKLRPFRSSSFFIKNDKEEIIGVLCVNIDIEPYEKVKELMDKLTLIGSSLEKNVSEEQLYENVDELLNNMIQEAISIIGVLPERMSAEEKIEVVKNLNNKGAFQLKGAVSNVARAIEVSEPTVYRYLNKLKEQ
jgi:predicted transcriptional regulator YheO